MYLLAFGLLFLGTSTSILVLERNGKFVVGGLYGVHDHLPGLHPPCGQISDDETLLTEAHVWSTNYVNEKILGKKNFKLGSYIIDTCNSNSIGLERSVKFVENVDHGLCKSGIQNGNSSSTFEKRIYSTTGTFTSGVGRNINYLLEAYCIPLIGAVSTSPLFDNEITNPYFLRTVASDSYQAKVVLDLLSSPYLRWTRINVVHDSSTYGYYLAREFQEMINDQKSETNVCVENYFELTLYKENAGWDIIKRSLDRSNGTMPKVFVLFLEQGPARTFFRYIREWGYVGKLQFVGVDGWSSWINLDGLEDVVVNSITSEPMMMELMPFKQYLLENVTLDKISYNPWLSWMIQDKHRCRLSGSKLQSNFTTECTGKEGLNSSNIPWLTPLKASKVFQSIVVIADGLLRLQEHYCPGSPDLCSELAKVISGELLHNYMRNTTISMEGVDCSFFDGTNSGWPRYTLYQFSGSRWNIIGYYSSSTNGSTQFTINDYFKNKTQSNLWCQIEDEINRCQGPCKERHYVKQLSRCCHKCVPCLSSFQYVDWSKGEPTCGKCKNGTIPDSRTNYTSCIQANITDTFIEFTTIEYSVLAACVVGIIITIPSCAILFHNRNSAMARAALVELLILLTLGLILLFLSPVLMLPSTSAPLCGSSWFVGSLILTFCHSIALVKSVRLARPSWYSKLVTKRVCQPELTTRLYIFASMIPQILISVMWITLRPPTMVPVSPTKSEGYIWSCSSNDEPHTVVVLMCPTIYLAIQIPFFLRALQNPFMYLVWQTRFIIAGWLSLACTYVVLLLVFFLQFDPASVDSKAVLLMSIPVVTAYLFWFSMIFPVVYVMTVKKNRNINEYVKRKRAQLFQEGNVIWMVTPVVRPSLSGSVDSEVSEAESNYALRKKASFEETFMDEDTSSTIRTSVSGSVDFDVSE